MTTLVISPPGNDLSQLTCANILRAEEPALALSILETEDIERIVFDARARDDVGRDLEHLIGLLPVTTRLLVIVETLPSSPICMDAGVIYLTPPINLADITGFLGYRQVASQ